MDKLTLEHLAPYLPYGLKVIYEYGNKIDVITSLYDIQQYEDIKIKIGYQDGEHIWMFEPILRPLSDLTKEIEHNGEKFVPLDELTEGDTVSMSLPDYAEDWDAKGYYTFQRYVNEWIEGDIHNLKFLPYGFIQKLLEWHFDVFHLIDAGLAVDINTIDHD